MPCVPAAPPPPPPPPPSPSQSLPPSLCSPQSSPTLLLSISCTPVCKQGPQSPLVHMQLILCQLCCTLVSCYQSSCVHGKWLMILILLRAAGHSPEQSSPLAEGPIARISPTDANSDRRRRDSAVESLTLARQAMNQSRAASQPSTLSRVSLLGVELEGGAGAGPGAVVRGWKLAVESIMLARQVSNNCCCCQPAQHPPAGSVYMWYRVLYLGFIIGFYIYNGNFFLSFFCELVISAGATWSDSMLLLPPLSPLPHPPPTPPGP